MKVSCPSCQTNYNIDDKRIPPGGAKLKCARCQNTFPIKAEEPVSAPAPAAVPLPGPTAPQANPYGGYDDYQRPAESEATRVVALPVPSAAYRDATAPQAIPLPGASEDYSDPSQGYGEAPGYDTNAGGAIPLPGASDPYAGDPYASNPYGNAPQADAVPLPGASDGYADNAGDPYASNPYGNAPQADAVPLPGASDGYADNAGGFDYAEDPYAAAPQADAIALPPPPAGAEEPYAYAATPGGAIALPPPPADNPYGADDSFLGSPPQHTSEVDTFALPPPPAADPYAAGGDDPFGLPPAPVEPEADPFGLPPAPAADPFAADSGVDDPFGLPPAQVEPEPEADPFGLPPAPAASADPFADEDPFALPPAPAAPAANLDFSEPSPSTVDVGMDFSEPPPAAPMASADASIPDALEFDPSAPVAGDDLEADLSAPLPPPTPGTADGLEMLSFIDDAAKDSGANKAAKSNVRRFHVRRRSGKVFGPFEEGVVVKMLEDGQLLGNEDVSNDGESWTPIGTVPTFAAAIQKLMEGPGTPAVAAAAPASPAAEPGSKANLNSAANMEKLQQMYGGRMAPVAVTDSTTKLEIFLGKVKQRLPQVIAAAAVLLVLIVGFSFSATRYGAFGLKKFMPAKVKSGSAEDTDVQAARKALLQDSFQGYKQAHALTGKVLSENEYPEVRAIWCQAVFHLQRRYSAANGSDLSRCRSEEEAASLELLGETNVEYTKYLVGSALVSRDVGTAIQLAKDAWSRDANQGDVELGLLLAEAQAAQKKDSAEAIDTLNRVLKTKPDLARAHHALGNLYQAGGKADEAAKAYEAALKADDTHLSSSVELAAVELLLRKDAQKGLAAAELALEEKSQAQMSAPELSRARTFKGIALYQLARLDDAEKELRAALEKDANALILKSYLARVLQAQRKFADALPFHEAVAKAEPQNLEATDGYISTLVTLGKIEDAQKLVEEAAKRFKDNARIEYLYGRVDEASDSNSSAEEHYTRALKADEKLVEAHVALGRLQLRLRRNEQAKARFEAAAALAPDSAWVQLGLGELALAEEDTVRAKEAFEKAVSLEATLADAHLGLSRLALLAGDLEKAQKEAETALELDPHTLRGGRLHRGIVLWRQGRLDDALTELTEAKKVEPRSVATLVTLAAVQIDKGHATPEDKPAEASNHFKEAEVNLTVALKSESTNPEANFYMAQVKVAQVKAEVKARQKAAQAKAEKENKEPEPVPAGDYSQAIESMTAAVERAPNRADYHYAFGLLYQDAKQLPEAIKEWQEAVKLAPKMAEAQEALGLAHLERNEFEEALTAFQAALKADPKRTGMYTAIGNTHFAAARWREAIRSYEQVLKADPGQTAVYFKLGRAWGELNQYPKAIDAYLKASKNEPKRADIWYHLGYAYKEKGKKKEAVKAFQEYMANSKADAVERKEVEDEISFLE
ncbi:zinc-ribbon domain-containing protein [Archangium gephyra]|uniref:tetratricopeptide repeat protein n=1 Tax=Archangium gephyra TaxID=48 RepID=UPI0035D49202